MGWKPTVGDLKNRIAQLEDENAELKALVELLQTPKKAAPKRAPAKKPAAKK